MLPLEPTLVCSSVLESSSRPGHCCSPFNTIVWRSASRLLPCCLPRASSIRIPLRLCDQRSSVTANSGSERTMRIRETHAKLMHYYGDHITYLNMYAFLISFMASFDLFVKNGRSRQWCEDHYLHYRACDQAYRIYTQIKGILEAVWNSSESHGLASIQGSALFSLSCEAL